MRVSFSPLLILFKPRTVMFLFVHSLLHSFFLFSLRKFILLLLRFLLFLFHIFSCSSSQFFCFLSRDIRTFSRIEIAMLVILSFHFCIILFYCHPIILFSSFLVRFLWHDLRLSLSILIIPSVSQSVYLYPLTYTSLSSSLLYSAYWTLPFHSLSFVH